MFNFCLADVLRLSMFGTIISLSKDIIKVPMQIPGHTSLYWMAILIIGKGLIKKFGAGIIMGLVSGTLAVILGNGNEGVLVFFKYFIPGLVIDILSPFFNHKLEKPFVAGVCGALASLAKMGVNIVLGIILKIPMMFLMAGIGFTAIFHTLFGITGGIIATVIIKRLKPRLVSWNF
jgi:hypothetical protein